MGDWKEEKLKNFLLIPIRNGLTKPSAIRGNGVKMIGMKEIFAMDQIGSIDMDRVPVNKKEFESSFIQVEDLLFARQSLSLEGAGKCSIVVSVKEPTVFESHLIRLRIDKTKANPYYIYYYFKSSLGKNKIKTLVQQVAAAGIRGKELVELSIPSPSIFEQNRIASILKSLDDKIECNRRINENLEQQAQALFKSWFVDFEPFRDGEFEESELGMIPQGWRVENLSSIADYINGLAMQKFRPVDGERGLPVLKIKELGQGSVDNNSELCSPSLIGEKYIIDDGDIIFSWSGTLMVKVWCGGKCGLNQHLFVVIPKDNPKWFVYQWTNYHLDNFIRIAKDKAVTMGHIKRGELDKAMVVVPDEVNMQRIDDLMTPIFEQIISLKKESRRLAELRDTLLPRLMSGGILL